MKRNILFFSILLLLYSCLFASTVRVDPDEYIVKIGDIFFIQALTLDTLVVRSPVLPIGALNLFPFADSVMIAGRTLTEAHSLIHSKIGGAMARDRVSIQLGVIAPTRFHVLGAVVRPGEYIAEELITLRYAIQMTGGLSSSASKRIRILRNNRILDFNLNDYFVNKDLSANPLIMHDDIIMVNLAENFVKVFTNNDAINMVEAVELYDCNTKISQVLSRLTMRHQWSNLDVFTVDRHGEFLVVCRDFELEPFDRLFIPVEELYVYVTGFVVRPGRLPYNGALNALYYISQSGGPNNNGSRSRIIVKREHGSRELYTGQAIQPGDTIYIPETFRSKVVSFMAPTATIVSVVSTTVLIMINLGYL